MEYFEERRVGSWSALKKALTQLREDQVRKDSGSEHRWVFRGQRDANWSISSRLTRECERFDIPKGKRTVWEYRIVREFMRHYPRFGRVRPTSIVEWLAVMQHHGAPTRLIDWTYSFWAAVAFAVEDAKPCEPCAIWALDFDWLHKRIDETLPKEVAPLSHDKRNEPENLRKVFDDGKEPGLFFLNPFSINTRLAVQQGLFLTTRDLSLTFEENLNATLKSSDTSDLSGRFVKVVLDVSLTELKTVLLELHRINLTHRTLFPGFDGFAQDLHNHLALDEFFVGVEDHSIWNWHEGSGLPGG